MARRNAKVRWPFACTRCGAWIPRGTRRYTDDGTWWFCQQCALEHKPERQESRP